MDQVLGNPRTKVNLAFLLKNSCNLLELSSDLKLKDVSVCACAGQDVPAQKCLDGSPVWLVFYILNFICFCILFLHRLSCFFSWLYFSYNVTVNAPDLFVLAVFFFFLIQKVFEKPIGRKRYCLNIRQKVVPHVVQCSVILES